MARNVTELLAPHLRPANSAPAQRFRTADGWTGRTYGELAELTAGVAAVLQGAGATRGTRVALFLPTRADWTVVDLALARIGAVSVPVYPTSAPAQVLDIVRRSTPTLLVVAEGQSLPAFPGGGPVVLRVGAADGDLGDLMPDGATASPVPVAASELYTISYSSGSTGAPKGCLLTHGNYVAVLEMALAAETHPERGTAHRDTAFVYLPLAHSSARLQQLTTLVAGGELVYGSGDTTAVLRQIAEVRPTYVPGVPRLFESAYVRSGRDPERLRAVFGDRLVYALTGGAPIAPEMLAVYEAAGIALVEGYGLTETATAIAISAPHSNRPGTVGRPLAGLDVQIADDGEIVVRGRNVFAGYLDDEVATAAAFSDGWFRTGDLGRIDDDGFLAVTGRKKNLIVTSTGKNIAPEPIENTFRRLCVIDSIVVVGEGRPYIAAVVTSGAHDVVDDDLVAAARIVNDRHAPPEWIRKIAVVPATLSVEAGELTASGKVVRAAVLERLARAVEAIYGGDPRVRVVEVVPHVVGAAH